jgi:hypothetical protein
MTTIAEKDKLIGRISQGIDLELHVKETKIDGLTFINIRDYVPSTQEYGQGALIRLQDLGRLMEHLGERYDYHFGRGGPVAGQQKLPKM